MENGSAKAVSSNDLWKGFFDWGLCQGKRKFGFLTLCCGLRSAEGLAFKPSKERFSPTIRKIPLGKVIVLLSLRRRGFSCKKMIGGHGSAPRVDSGDWGCRLKEKEKSYWFGLQLRLSIGALLFQNIRGILADT